MLHVLGRHSMGCFPSNTELLVFESKPEKPESFLFLLMLCVSSQKSFMGILEHFVLGALSQEPQSRPTGLGSPSAVVKVLDCWLWVFFSKSTPPSCLCHICTTTLIKIFPHYKVMAQYLLPAPPLLGVRVFGTKCLCVWQSSAPRELFQAICLKQGNIFCLTKGDNSAFIQK